MVASPRNINEFAGYCSISISRNYNYISGSIVCDQELILKSYFQHRCSYLTASVICCIKFQIVIVLALFSNTYLNSKLIERNVKNNFGFRRLKPR